MSGLLRRLSRRRPATADETGPTGPASSEPAGAPADAPAEPGGDQPVPDEQATQVLPATAVQPAQPASVADAPPPDAVEQPAAAGASAQVEPPAPVRDLPAGIDPNELAAGPAPSAGRGKLRRRLRYLRGVRELLLRDLGGFTYEVHRSAGGTPQEPQRKLAESKARRIETLDAEVRALEIQLAEPHVGPVLHEPGIGGLCPQCGELHASDAQYCARCGAPLNAKARAKRDAAVAAAAQPATGSQPTVEPAPASVLWAGGPKPRTQAAAEAEAEAESTEPSVVTNEWLALPKRPEDAPAATRPAPKPEASDDDATRTAGGDDPATPHEPAVGDEPPADAPAKTAGEGPRVDEPPTTTDEHGRAEDFASNGKGDEDVPDPEPLGDPLASRREEGS